MSRASRMRGVARAGLLVATACNSSSSGGGPTGGDASVEAGVEAGKDAGGPVITALKVVQGPNSVLTAVVTFTTDRPALDHVHVANLADGGARRPTFG